ncbi:MAG: hypothetical protein ACO36E_12820 [Synechocystis sp.]
MNIEQFLVRYQMRLFRGEELIVSQIFPDLSLTAGQVLTATF